MCDRKGEGGRCFPHKEGTQAAIEMAEIMTELPKAHIQLTAKELKQEGKELPTPSEEEVIAFAMTNQFTAKYDPRVPEAKREKIARKWKKAEKENPNGGEFHSWKHTMVESVKRYKRTAVAALLGGSIMLTSACGMLPNNNNNNPAPTPEVTVSAPASPTTSATASPKPTESTPTVASKIEAERKANEKIRKESQALLKSNGINVTNKMVKSPNGEYPQISVDKNGKFSKFDSSKHSGGLPEGWTKKDASEAQAFGMNFMLQEVVDTSVTGSKDNIGKEYESWKKRNVSKLHPEVKNEFLSQPVETNIIDYSWQNDPEFTKANYSYPYDGVTPRVKSVNMDLVDSQEFRGGIYYKYSGTISMNGQSSKNKNISETADMELSYTVLKVDGKYVIAGIANHVTIDTGTVLKQMDIKK